MSAAEALPGFRRCVVRHRRWSAARARRRRQEFISFSSNPRNILEGNWQSCRERDGSYAERVYDHVVNGVAQFEVHLGPRREFAIFHGVQDEHREHDSADNLLKPVSACREDGRAKQRWEIPSLKLAFTVTLGRRIAHRLRELVHPPRAAGKDVALVGEPASGLLHRCDPTGAGRHSARRMLRAWRYAAVNDVPHGADDQRDRLRLQRSPTTSACLHSLLAQTRPARRNPRHQQRQHRRHRRGGPRDPRRAR